VLKIAGQLVFGRILPALGLMMCLSTLYYAWLAYRLAQKTEPHRCLRAAFRRQRAAYFIVTFVIMLPITIKTGDPMKGWSGGAWSGFPEFILMIGGFIAPTFERSRPAPRCSARSPAYP